MITAVDTNVLLDILIPNEAFFHYSSLALGTSALEGPLVICDIVFAELLVHFSTLDECRSFLSDAHIQVEPLESEAQFLASRVWRTYRRQGGKRSRILADFLIGAHARVQASRLLTRDRGFYGPLFPDLVLIDPSTAQR